MDNSEDITMNVAVLNLLRRWRASGLHAAQNESFFEAAEYRRYLYAAARVLCSLEAAEADEAARCHFEVADAIRYYL